MEHDLAADLLRLVDWVDGSERHAIRPGAIEPPNLDIGNGDGLRRKTIGRDQHMRAARWRLDDDRAALLAQPCVAASGSADDLSTPILVIARCGNLYHWQTQAGHLAEHAAALADFEGVKTLLEGH